MGDSCLQVFAGTTPENSSVIDAGTFITPAPRVNITQVLQHLLDMTYYTVWLVAEDMQSPPLQQSTATKVVWQQPYLMPPQMNASITPGSAVLGDRCDVPTNALLHADCPGCNASLVSTASLVIAPSLRSPAQFRAMIANCKLMNTSKTSGFSRSFMQTPLSTCDPAFDVSLVILSSPCSLWH